VSLWLVAVVVIGAAIALLALYGIRRPRSAEDELRRPSRAPAPRTGLPAQASMREAIKALAWERATGRLEITSGDKRCSLYFLFGHLFHAECGDLKGDAAFQAALTWPGTSCKFDSKSSLPKDETIRHEPSYQDL
jgi:hypothetical protein